MSTIGEKIYKSRKKAGLSQEELADKLGVSRQTVYKWESGSVQPNSENISALCEVLGVNKDEFYDVDVNSLKCGDTLNETAVTSYRKKNKVVFISLIINTVCLIGLFLATLFSGLMTISSNTGDAQATTNTFDYGVFIVFLCLLVVDLAVELSLIIAMKRKK